MLVLRQRGKKKKKKRKKTGTGCVFSDTRHHLIDRNSRRKKKGSLFIPKKTKETKYMQVRGFLFLNFFSSVVYFIY
jgi:hypothetical protein